MHGLVAALALLGVAGTAQAAPEQSGAAADARQYTAPLAAMEAAKTRIPQTLDELCLPVGKGVSTVAALAAQKGALSVPNPERGESFQGFTAPDTAWSWPDAAHLVVTDEWFTPLGGRGCRVYVMGGDIDAAMATVTAFAARQQLQGGEIASAGPGARQWGFGPAGGERLPMVFITRDMTSRGPRLVASYLAVPN